MNQLVLLNRQRRYRIERPPLVRLLTRLLHQHLRQPGYQLGVTFVGARRMSHLHRQFLNASGSTDVLTFDHGGSGPHSPLHGEIFVCVDDAAQLARQFHTTWAAEIVRYILHGILHLRGHDDLQPAARRLMKLEENRRLRTLLRQPEFKRFARASTCVHPTRAHG